jgi:hypothetical protein
MDAILFARKSINRIAGKVVVTTAVVRIRGER